jgi:hypothetical protein
MTVPDNKKYIRPKHVMVQDLDGEAVLLNLDNGQYYGLDAIGFRMYDLLVTTGSFDKTYEVLQQEYQIYPKKLRSDLDKLLKDLLLNGLVSVAQMRNKS